MYAAILYMYTGTNSYLNKQEHYNVQMQHTLCQIASSNHGNPINCTVPEQRAVVAEATA